jgi:hypothetical protein
MHLRRVWRCVPVLQVVGADRRLGVRSAEGRGEGAGGFAEADEGEPPDAVGVVHRPHLHRRFRLYRSRLTADRASLRGANLYPRRNSDLSFARPVPLDRPVRSCRGSRGVRHDRCKPEDGARHLGACGRFRLALRRGDRAARRAGLSGDRRLPFVRRAGRERAAVEGGQGPRRGQGDPPGGGRDGGRGSWACTGWNASIWATIRCG